MFVGIMQKREKVLAAQNLRFFNTITKLQHFNDACFFHKTLSSVSFGLSMRLVDNKIK